MYYHCKDVCFWNMFLILHWIFIIRFSDKYNLPCKRTSSSWLAIQPWLEAYNCPSHSAKRPTILWIDNEKQMSFHHQWLAHTYGSVNLSLLLITLRLCLHLAICLLLDPKLWENLQCSENNLDERNLIKEVQKWCRISAQVIITKFWVILAGRINFNYI